MSSARSWAASGLIRRPAATAVPTDADAGKAGGPTGRRRVPARPRPRPGDGQVGLLQGRAGAEVAEDEVPLGQPAGQGRHHGRTAGAVRGPEAVRAGALLGDGGTRPDGAGQRRGVDGRPGREPDGPVGGARGQLAGRALGQDPSVVDDHHVVGQPLGLGQLVGGEDHADAPVPLGGDEVAHHDPAFGIDAGGGLVQEQHLGLPDQGQGQGQALALATGEPSPRGPAHPGQAYLVEQAVGVLGVVVVRGEQVEHPGPAPSMG